MRYIVTVNRDRIDKGEPNPIRVEDTETGLVAHSSDVELGHGSRIVSRPSQSRQDGATVWIESDTVWVTV